MNNKEKFKNNVGLLVVPIMLMLVSGCTASGVHTKKDVVEPKKEIVNVINEPAKYSILLDDEVAERTKESKVVVVGGNTESKEVVEDTDSDVADETETEVDNSNHDTEKKQNTVKDTPKEVTKSKEPKKSNADIAKEVIAGKWGSGSQRTTNLTNAGYDAQAIQAEVNKVATKPTGSSSTSNTGANNSSGSSSSNDTATSTNYRANAIYIGGSPMSIRATDYNGLQSVIDSTSYTWVSLGTYSPTDNSGTFFGMHSHLGGSAIYGLGVGSKVTVTDSSGTPHVYTVGNVYRNNMSENFTDELLGNLGKEYIVLQTCEPRVNGQWQGNRHVIANK